MGINIALFLGIWFAAAVVIGMVTGRMMRVGGRMPHPARVMKQPVRSGAGAENERRRAA